MLFNPPQSKNDFEYLPMEGGYDTETPPLKLPPGYVREAQNYEIAVIGGYQRVKGYERFDGRPMPSAAVYTILPATITGSWAVGNTLTGLTSGATGVIVDAVTTGASTYFVLTKVSGTYNSSESLQISAVTIATSTGAPSAGSASTPQLNAYYLNGAADQYRSDITAVPGSGSVLGVWVINNVVYAWRANAGGTAVDIYKSTSSGWTQVALQYEISFTAGSGDVDDGDTLTQGAVTATIDRVVIESGALATTDAAGRLIISSISGGPFSAGAATTTGAGALTLSGAESAITIATGGKYEFVDANFTGSSGTKRTYGCDGANRGFEFDGTVYVPISTGMSPDTPKHVAAHKNHLFFSYGSSAQHSGIATPYKWTLLVGAAELSVGDIITGFRVEPGSELGGALGIYTLNRTNMLYGSSSSDWQLVPFRDEVGAVEWSLQQIGMTMFLGDRGLTTLQQSQSYGNFASATISNRIKSFVETRRTKVVTSCIARAKNQYRIYFNDNYALHVTLDNNKLRGIMPQLLSHTPSCLCSVEDTTGSEVIYMGCTNGFVYQMEKGTSFDGDPIEAFYSMVFNHQKSPRALKRYRRAIFELTGSGYHEFNFSYQLGYGTTDKEQGAPTPFTASVSPPYWDTMVWDSFIWDGLNLVPEQVDITGSAENISLKIHSSSDYFGATQFSGLMLHYTMRREKR